jgi:HSP20 family protein
MRELVPWRRGRSLEHGKRDLEHTLETFHRDLNHMFDDVWRGFELPVLGHLEGRHEHMSPRVDFSEDDKAIRVSVELPGMDEKDFEVMVSDNLLTIKGEKKAEKEEKEQHYTYTERSFGSFQRSIPLDADVVSDKIDAAFADGVLTITLPKTPAAQKKYRKVPIHTAGKVRTIGKKAA